MENNSRDKIITLFEYGEWKEVENKASLKAFLQNIWQLRLRDQTLEEEPNEDVDSRYQPFLKFDDNSVRANNYIGFIQNGGQLIEIYPKVFRNTPNPDRKLMLRHIFYWFSYCRKWRFPFTQASLDNDLIDSFPELIIYLIAKQIFETVSTQPFMQYQVMEERMTTPKGSINFNRYINQSFSRGNYHFLECDYEPFAYDNKVNRIIKYCSRLLLAHTRLPETQRLIQETLFILDEVEDTSCGINDIDSISFNAFFEEYTSIMQMCRSILEQQIYSNNSYELSQWCLLFPMEYVFEDFVAGFLEKHFSKDWKVEYQKSNMYLCSAPDAFQMQHDIFLTSRINPKRKIIIDTKYKLRDCSSNEKKSGVAQSDLYQLTSYAYRQGSSAGLLIYPNANEKLQSTAHFKIPSGLKIDDVIHVKGLEIPFWAFSNLVGLSGEIMKSLQKGLAEDSHSSPQKP